MRSFLRMRSLARECDLLGENDHYLGKAIMNAIFWDQLSFENCEDQVKLILGSAFFTLKKIKLS